MAKSIQTSILIQASPEKIWTILTDFERYPQWNPFIIYISGKATEGSSLTVQIQPPQSKSMTFRPVVTSVKKFQELSWLGKLLFKGLFDGAHHFRLQDNSDGSTTFFQSEDFSGILSNIIPLKHTEAGFHLMNQKLKEIAEGL